MKKKVILDTFWKMCRKKTCLTGGGVIKNGGNKMSLACKHLLVDQVVTYETKI